MTNNTDHGNIPWVEKGPNEHTISTPNTTNVSELLDTSYKEVTIDRYNFHVALDSKSDGSEIFSTYPCVMSNNLYDNGNVSQIILNISDTQNISVNSLPSLEVDTSEPFTNETLDEVVLEDSDSSHLEDNPNNILSQIKAKNCNRLVKAHININFLEKKFELASLVKDKVDILLASETNLDATFLLNQLTIDGYSEPIRVDRNCHGGGLVFFIRDDLHCKVLTHNLPKDVEGIFIELILRKAKWLLMGGYNPHKSSISYFFSHASKQLDYFLPTYESDK